MTPRWQAVLVALLAAPLLQTEAGPVDDAIDQAVDLADAVSPVPVPPRPVEVEPTYFRDGFEAGAMGGAHGTWDTVSKGPAAPGWTGPAFWTAADAAALGTPLGMRFGGPGFGYPVPREGPLVMVLASPRINLAAVPYEVEPAPGGDAGSTASGAHDTAMADPLRIHLTAQEAWNLLEATGSSTGRDSDTVELVVYTSDPRLPWTNLGGGVAVPDIGAGRAQLVGQSLPRGPGAAPDAARGGHVPAHQAVYDLTPFAGQDIWIGYRVTVQPSSSPDFLFATAIDTAPGFAGGRIDEVVIEGPTWAHNLVLDAIIDPFMPVNGRDDKAGRFIAAGDAGSLSALVLNRGRTAQSATASATLHAAGGEPEACTGPPARFVDPGQVVRVDFSCPAVAVDQAYTLHVQVAAPIDQAPHDDVASVALVGQDPVILRQEGLQVTPRLGIESDVRKLAITVWNAGLVDTSAKARLDIAYRPNETVAFVDALGQNHTAEVLGERNQTLTLPATGHVPTKQHLQWEALLVEPGQYRLTVVLETPTDQTIQASVLASTRIATGTVFEDAFDGQGVSGSGTWVGDWTASEISSPPSPCPDCTAWRTIPSVAGLPPNLGPVAHLLGRVDLSALPVEDLALEGDVVALDVRYTHRIPQFACWQSQRVCAGNDENPTEFHVWFHRFADPGAGSQDTLPPPPASAGVLATPGAIISKQVQLFTDAPATPADAGGEGDSHAFNRLSYANVQWIDEAHRVPLARPSTGEFDPVPTQGYPLASLHGSVLELRAAFPPNSNARAVCADQKLCAGWSILQAELVAVMADGRNVTLLRSGTDELGTWISAARASGNPNAGFYRDPLQDKGDASCRPIAQTGPASATGADVPGLVEQVMRGGAAGTPRDLVRCPGWVRETPGGPGPSHWAQRSSGMPEPLNNTLSTTDATLLYEDGRVDMLLSPALVVPDAPLSLKLSHQFLFHSATFQADHGRLFVRTGAIVEGEFVPNSTLLPVVLHDRHDRLQAFVGSDCGYYRTMLGEQDPHPEPDCKDGDPSNDPKLVQRSAVEQTFDLGDLTVLDYRRVGAANATTPDPAARVGLDLRGKTVQFAFVSSQADWSLIQSGGTDTKNGLSVRGGNRIDGNSAGEGWFLHKISVSDPLTAHDVAVTGIDFDVDYDWRSLGLGPEGPGKVLVTLTNLGVLQETDVTVVVEAIDASSNQPAATWTASLPDDALLVANATVQVPIAVQFPAEGTYVFEARATINAVDPLQQDEFPGNDCASVDAQGAVRPCLLKPLHVLRARPDLRVDASVSPQASARGLPIDLDVRVSNHGNVVVAGSTLRVAVRPAGAGEPVVDTTWTVQTSPGPSASAPWTDLILSRGGTPALPMTSFTLEQQGTFVLVVTVDDGQGLDTHVTLLASYDEFFVDDFDGNSRRSLRTSGDFDGAAGWVAPDAPGPSSDRVGHWLFGKRSGAAYDADLEGILRLPDADLSGARSAYLSFRHAYEFEDGFDGGVVEYSFDGQAWQPLTPRGGYPATVLDSSPLDLRSDPATPMPAYTGSTQGQMRLAEFDLSSIPELASSVVLADLSTDGFDAVDPEPGAAGRSFSSTWRLPGTAFCDVAGHPDCWYRHDRTAGVPARNPAFNASVNAEPWDAGGELRPLVDDEDYWWVDWTRLGDKISNVRWADLELDLHIERDATDPQSVRIRFWQWKDVGGHGVEADAIDMIRQPGPTLAHPYNAFLSQPEGDETKFIHIPPTVRPAGGGWSEVEMVVPSDVSGDVTLHIRHWQAEDAPQTLDNVPSRGMVVDDVLVENYKLVNGVQTVTHVQPYASDCERLVGEGEDAEFQSCWNPVDQRWQRDQTVPAVGTQWTLATQTDRHSQDQMVWRFSNTLNADDWLVSPLVHLEQVGGDEALLRFWETFTLRANDVRSVWMQRMLPTATGEQVPGPWEPLFTDAPATNNRNSQACSATNWCEQILDVSHAIGSAARFAFSMRTSRFDPAGSWALDDVRVEAESLVGRPIQLRLRAATDGNIGAAGWRIDDVQLVGYTYEDNVALIADEPLRDASMAVGQPQVVTGVVRNLGDTAADIRLEASLVGLGEATPAAAPTFSSSQAPESAQVTLMPAGTTDIQGNPLDRKAFTLTYELPEGADPGKAYVLRIEAKQKPFGSDLFLPITDENPGDHVHEVTLTVDDTQSMQIVAAHVSPPDPARREPIDIEATWRNDGVVGGTLHAQAVIRLVGAQLQELARQDLGSVAIAPGREATLGGTWAPEHAGLHRIEVEQTLDFLAGSTTETRVIGHVLVDTPPIFYMEGFESGDGGWTAQSLTNRAYCGQKSTASGPPDGWQTWSISDATAFDGQWALRIGVDPLAGPGAGLPPQRDEVATGPSVDLRGLADLGHLDEALQPSPLAPLFGMRYQSDLGMPSGIVAQAKVGSGGGDAGRYVLPGTSNAHVSCGDFNPLAGGLVPGASAGRQVLTGSSDAWLSAKFPLGQRLDPSDPATFVPGKQPQFIFRLGTASQPLQQTTGARSFAVDAVSVSSYDMELVPATREVSLRGVVDKEFSIVVRNTGAARDTYALRIAGEQAGALPGFLRHELSPAQLSVPAGGEARAALRVWVDPDADPKQLTTHAGLPLVVEATSLADPARAALSKLVIGSFAPRRLPDLDVRLAMPQGEAAQVLEGEQASIVVQVRNVGDAPSLPASLVVVACPVDLDESDCLPGLAQGRSTGLAGAAGVVLHDPAPIKALPSPNLDPAGASWSKTFDWKPLLGDRGDYSILAWVDAAGLLEQYDRGNDVARMPFKVLGQRSPDLWVNNLVVSDASGKPVDRAAAGQILTVSAQVTNAGDADAADVEVRIQNRGLLKSTFLPIVAPGQVVPVETAFIASPGNWLVSVTAITHTTVERAERPNDAAWPLVVTADELDIQVWPPRVALAPGASRDVVVRFSNGLLENATLLAEVDEAPQLRVIGLPQTIDVLRGGTEVRTITVTAGELAKGEHTLTFATRARVGGDAETASLQVEVLGVRKVAGTLAPAELEGRTALLAATVRNDGTTTETLSLSASAPRGWAGVVVPDRLTLGPGAKEAVTVHATPPAAVPPGTYTVELVAGALRLAEAHVVVAGAPAWASRLVRVDADGPGFTAQVRVTNVGNEAGVPPLPEGFVQPMPSAIRPGAMAVYDITTNASELLLPGDTAPVRLDVPLPPAGLRLGQIDAPSRAAAGQQVVLRVEVANDGERQEAVPVRAFVNGLLVSENRTALAGYATSVVALAWVAQPGDHAVAIVAGSGAEASARSTRLQVEPAHEQAPGISFVLLLAVVLLAARRRR